MGDWERDVVMQDLTPWFQTQTSNSLVMEARNGLQDANLAARLNFTLPPSTYKQMLAQYSKEYSGDAMYKKIIADAESQLHRLSCFVAGTLVHTKEGLKPIEQIKVGDYVLSKPESGEGKVSYKRVSRTFENGEKEVWFVSYAVEGDRRSKFVVATAEHPFWVKRTITPLHDVYEESVWVKTADLYRRFEEGLKVVIELADGDEAYCDFIGPMVALSPDAKLYSGFNDRPYEASSTPDRGLVYSSFGLGEGNSDSVIDFSKGYPEQLLESDGEYVHAYADLDKHRPYDHLAPDAVTFVTRGHTPLLRKVYNLEVEDNHTYYVGECGVLIHNTCQKQLEGV